MSRDLPPKKILEWYLEAGVDEAVADEPHDRFADGAVEPEAAVPLATAPETGAPARPTRAPAPSGATPPVSARPDSSGPTPAGEAAVSEAHRSAHEAASVDELRAILTAFDGCPLKKTATNLVFGDGNPNADVVFIGEAPGAEEDRRGIAFVGPSGQLLDRMLASVGLDRTKVFISNTVFWRPPGNRNPTTGEMAVCMPFVERLIELVDPSLLVAVGGPAANSLLAQNSSVGRLRGRWFPYSSPGLARPIEATAIYHPAYLLRSPAQKRAAWQDMLEIRRKIRSLGLGLCDTAS